MKKRKKKWIRGTRGAISLILALLMLPFYSLAAVLVEAGRYQSAVRTLDEALSVSAYSVLSDYDSYLKDRFGLLAVSQDGDLSGSARSYLDRMQLTDLAAVNLSSLEAQGMYPLADITVLRRQVMEYSKLSVPANLAVDALNINDLISKLEDATKMVPLLESLSAGCDTVGASADALIALEDLQKDAQKTKDAASAYHSAFSEWEGSVSALIDHLKTERPSANAQADEKEKKESEKAAKEWDDTREDLIKEAEKKQKKYQDEIEDLISAIDSLHSGISEVEAARVKLESSMVNFTSVAADSVVEMDKEEVVGDKEDLEDWEQAYKDAADNHSAMQGALQSANSGQEARLRECLDSFQASELQAASAQLQREKSAVSSYNYGSLNGDSGTPDPAVYHAAQVDSLADADAIAQALDEAEDDMNDSAPMDFINTLIDVLESLFQTKTVIDPALNGKLDTSYYQSSYGGLPSAKDRSSAAHRLETGNSADEQKSMDFLAQIDPDYDPSDPYGTGSSFDTSLVEKIMRNVSDMLSAAKKIGGDAESLREFLEAIKDFVTSVVNLVSNTIAFMQQIVARVAELVGGAVYERLLLNGYLVYHIPNRTDYETGKSLAGMSYSQAGLSYDPGDVHFTYPGSDMMQIIQAIASGGGKTQKSFDGAELEYILWGVNSEAANQAMHFSALYLMRLLLNLPGILTNKEVSSLAAAANVFAPIVYIVYIFAEPYIDTLFLVNGESVPIVKMTPYLTVGGLDDLIGKATSLTIPDSVKSDLKTEAAKLTGADLTKSASSGSGNPVKKYLKGLLDMDYSQQTLIMMCLFGSERLYLNRLADIIQTESTAYREKNRSLSQSAGGISGRFDIDESYTALRVEASGSMVQLLPVPSLSTNSMFETTRLIYRGY